MATEIGNQLLARVRDEMGRNIATIKRQLIEWLERPETGGIDILRDNLAEISGSLSLIGQGEAVALAEAINAGITGLSQDVVRHGVDASFAGHGAEIAAGLLVLADYVERLDHLGEHNRQSAIQATEAVKSIAAADKDIVHVSAQPFISKETYQALAGKIDEVVEASRNQIEQHIRNPEAPFNAASIIEANQNLINFFAVLEFKTPQSLLQQVNQQISAQLSEQQWVDIAEAMILVQESLKQAEHAGTVRQTDNFSEAVQAQTAHSRQLEVERLIHDIGKSGKHFFETLRKEVLHAETIRQGQPWHEATAQLVHYSAIIALAGLKELAAQLQHLGLLFAEFTLQKDETLAKTCVPVIEALVAVEYLFSDLAETGKISLHDVNFLAEAVGKIDKVCPVSAQAKSLFVQLANMAPPDNDEEEGSGDIEQFRDVLDSALDVLNDDFSMLKVREEEQEGAAEEAAEEPPLSPVMLAGMQKSGSPAAAVAGLAQFENGGGAAVTPANQGAGNIGINGTLGMDSPAQAGPVEGTAANSGEVSAAEADLDEAGANEGAVASDAGEPSAIAEGSAGEPAVTAGMDFEQTPVSAAGGALPAVAYFADKSLDDLQVMDVPAEKVSFAGSQNADAVMDEEIREFFNEELAEIVGAMNSTYPQWREKPDDGQLTTDIRRAFHTLKGSGRTVGYESLGEFAWQHEQLLNRVLEKDFKANSLVCDTIGDAVSLLNVLLEGEEFIEHKGALLQQALVAERVRLSLLDAPQSEQDVLDALSRKLRLSDGAASPAADIAATAQTAAGLANSDATDDWAAFADDISLDAPTATEEDAPATILADGTLSGEQGITDKTETGHRDGTDIASALAGDGAAHEAKHAASAVHGEPAAGTDSGIDFAFTESDIAHEAAQTIAATAHAQAHTDDAEATDFTLDDEGTVSDAAPSEAADTAEQSSSAPASEIAAAGISGSESYDKALRTLQCGLRMGEPDADMQAALAETIRRQWQQGMADDPAMRAAMTQSLIESFKDDSTGQAQWVSDILAQANAAGNAAVPVQPGLVPQMSGAPAHAAPSGISQEAYDRMLTTLRRGLAAGADEDMQAVLSDTISRQWLQQGIDTEGEARDAIIGQLKASLLEEGVADEAVLDAMLETVPHRVPSILPEGVRQDSYGIMMETLRAGLSNASSADVQEMLATAIGNQWQNQNSLQDSAIRAAVAEQMAAVLGGNGQENSALVEAVLNRAAEKAREIPTGIRPDDYHNMLDTLRSNISNAQSDEAQDALAASISAHWQEQSLQDEAARDAVAQRIIAALGGKDETDSAAVEAVLNRVAEKMARQQAASDTNESVPSGTTAGFAGDSAADIHIAPGGATADFAGGTAIGIGLAPGGQHSGDDVAANMSIETTALPQGVRQESYGAMLQTLKAGIGAAQNDAAAQEALAASIGAQWQEAHTLHEPATRAAVAQQISAALGDKADMASVEHILERAAAQAGELPQGVEQSAYGAMLQTLQAGIGAAQNDAVAQEALAASIGAQWQEAHTLHEPATRAAVAQQISAALGDKADVASVEHILERAAAQAGELPQGVEQSAYGAMLQTLQAGIGAAQNDAAAQEALAASIGAQWQEAHTLHEPATRAAVAQQISAALGDKADVASVEHILERAAAQAGELPQGVEQAAYGDMLQTLHAGIGIAQSDTAAQEELAATIGAQWREPHSLQDSAARSAVAQQIASALGDKANAADVGAVLNRAARQAAELPQGVRQEAYGRMLHSMRFGEIHGDAAEQEMLAAAIGAQWQDPHSLQDAATRATVAQQLATALDGIADTATVSDILDRAATQAAQLPQDVRQSAYGAMLQKLHAGIGDARDNPAAQEALAAAIGARWREEHTLQDPAARAAVAQQLTAALGEDADATTISAVLERAAAQAGFLPQGVRQDAYGDILQTLHAGIGTGQDDAVAHEALAASIGAQWQEAHSLHDPATRAAVAQQLTAALGDKADAAGIEAILNRAAAQAGELPQGVTQGAYGTMLQTLQAGIGAARGDTAAQDALAASISREWQEQYSLQDPAIRAAMTQHLCHALGEEADAATIGAVLERAAVKAAENGALPENLPAESYEHLLSLLRRGLADGDADTRAALSVTLQRQWQQKGLPQDVATISAVQQQLGAALAAEGIDAAQLPQVFAGAGLGTGGQPGSEMGGNAALPQDGADVTASSDRGHDFVDMAADAAPAERNAGEFVDAAAAGQAAEAGIAADFVDVAGGAAVHDDAEIYPHDAASGVVSGFIDTAGVPGDIKPLPEGGELPATLGGIAAGDIAAANASLSSGDKGSPTITATLSSIVQIIPSRSMSPAERLNRELASLAQHPGLGDAVQGGKTGDGSIVSNHASFLRAVDQFDTLSQLADKNESPEIIDDLIDAVYDIEDSIDSEVAPPWIWRLLDSIEQLLLTHKQEGTPVSLSCAAVLRQSAGLIENFEEDANEEDAIEAINALLNARRETGGGKGDSEPAILPYSGDPLGSELVEDPNANTMLAETFIDEAMSLFAHSQEEAERWDENREQLSRLDAIRRDMHTLKGSARMAGYNAIGDLTHGVESLIDGIVNGQAEASSKATSILVGAMWQGMLMLDTVRDGYLPQTDPYILNNIHSYLNQPLPYPEVAEAAELARQEAREEAEAAAAVQTARIEAKDLTPEPAEETPVEDVAVATEFDENIDPVLVDIFTDEAQELLQTTSQLLEDDFSKSEVVEELQRTMHTLKGGARLVGFTAIGDTAHLMESVIDKVPELAESKVRQAKTLLHFGLDAHYEMLDSVMRHEMPQPALDVNESLKAFADSGQYRVPSQGKGGAGADEGTPSEQATTDNTLGEAPSEPAAADSKGGQTSGESAADTGATGSAKGEGASRSEPDRADSHSGGHTDEVAASAAPSSATPAPAHGDSKVADKAPAAQADKHDTPPEHAPDLEKERASDISRADDKKDEAPKEKDSKDSATGSDNLPRYVRVDAQLLDEMIAMTGETAIMRSRMENIISEAEFNLTELTRVATRIAEQMRRLDSETEAQMLYRHEQQGDDDLHFDPLEMDRFSEIQQLSRQLSEAIDDLKNLQDTLSQDNTTLRNLSIQQGIIQRGIQDHLLTTQLMRFDVHEARLRRLVRQTAKSVGKDVNFILEGGEVEVERRLLEDILPALEHMIRNSLAHGIEPPEVRLATGKSETGTIKVKVGVHAAELSVDVLDDGQGLNYERIRDKAAAKGMLDPERADDESYLSSLILRSGFSTAESLSQLAGRGVGMDVVNEMVKQRRGQIVVRSKRGEGTMFTLNMPFSMSIAEVLLVEIAGQTFAAPMSSVKAIGQVSHEVLQRSVDSETVYQNYENKDYRQFVLGAYFKPDQYTLSDEEANAPVLFINSEDNPVAFHVDRILNRLEIIVKNVNRQVLNIPGISGATILGDGRVVPVLELLDLSRRIADLTTLHEQHTEEAEAAVPNILVVDDSVTMRKVSTRLLERHHYNVATAKDGLDAIEVLNAFTPDVILLDIEMPRMDGFEFASHVRHSSNVPDVPIVMITSRTGDKHRERADAIGVQGYLGKPYSEDMLIQTLEFLLKKGGDN